MTEKQLEKSLLLFEGTLNFFREQLWDAKDIYEAYKDNPCAPPEFSAPAVLEKIELLTTYTLAYETSMEMFREMLDELVESE